MRHELLVYHSATILLPSIICTNKDYIRHVSFLIANYVIDRTLVVSLNDSKVNILLSLLRNKLNASNRYCNVERLLSAKQIEMWAVGLCKVGEDTMG